MPVRMKAVAQQQGPSLHVPTDQQEATPRVGLGSFNPPHPVSLPINGWQYLKPKSQGIAMASLYIHVCCSWVILYTADEANDRNKHAANSPLREISLAFF